MIYYLCPLTPCGGTKQILFKRSLREMEGFGKTEFDGTKTK
jgi:hypothetical protein